MRRAGLGLVPHALHLRQAAHLLAHPRRVVAGVGFTELELTCQTFSSPQALYKTSSAPLQPALRMLGGSLTLCKVQAGALHKAHMADCQEIFQDYVCARTWSPWRVNSAAMASASAMRPARNSALAAALFRYLGKERHNKQSHVLEDHSRPAGL